jgi:hypothetical protein
MMPLLLTFNISRPPVMYHVLSDERLRCSMPSVLAVFPVAHLVARGQPMLWRVAHHRA